MTAQSVDFIPGGQITKMKLPEDDGSHLLLLCSGSNPATVSVPVWWCCCFYSGITFLMYKCGLISSHYNETALMTGSNYSCTQHYPQVSLFSQLQLSGKTAHSAWIPSLAYFHYINATCKRKNDQLSKLDSNQLDTHFSKVWGVN